MYIEEIEKGIRCRECLIPFSIEPESEKGSGICSACSKRLKRQAEMRREEKKRREERIQAEKERKARIQRARERFLKKIAAGEEPAVLILGRDPQKYYVSGDTLAVPRKAVGTVIGRGGQRIKLLSRIAGKHIQVIGLPETGHISDVICYWED